MKQILQSLSSGETALADVPCPAVKRGGLLIRTQRSLVSAGTERMLVEFGRAGLLQKARQQPDKVRQVIDKARAEGVLSTMDAVRSKLDQPLALGYCNVGVVEQVGDGVRGFKPGDRVACNGSHAEVVSVPQHLCARIPDNVSDESATFTVIGAIALQGVRLASPTLGESFVVIGLGLIGLVAVQILRASGCRVFGIDPDASKRELAKTFGAEVIDSQAPGVVDEAIAFSRGAGVDGVLICAATQSNEPVRQAAQMSRKRGRIVLVGVTGLELSRADFYEKELTFQVSCSYGPGRYDAEYEEKGNDYPLGYVRWTEQRNFQAILDLMASGSLDVSSLISHRYQFEEAIQAYGLLAGVDPYLGIILEYPSMEKAPDSRARTVVWKSHDQKPLNPTLAVLGAGNYAGRVLLPAFKRADVNLVSLVSSGGVSGSYYGQKFGFDETTTDTDRIIADDRANTLVIATRHDSHARLVLQGLAAGKHVFVEKPLCLTLDELEQIEAIYSSAANAEQGAADQATAPILTVGFNRRFAPLVQALKERLDESHGTRSIVITVNAGEIPSVHWTQDPNIGGGRIIGEACHFIDLVRFLGASKIASWDVSAMSAPGAEQGIPDTVTITLRLDDGSIGTIHYFSNGHKSFPKETIQVFGSGRILQMDNFRSLRGWGWKGMRTKRSLRQDKGQNNMIDAFIRAIRNGMPPPIPIDEVFEVSRVSIAVSDAVSAGSRA